MSLELDVRKDTTGNISSIRYSNRYRLVVRRIAGIASLVVVSDDKETPVCERENIVHLIEALRAAQRLWQEN
jgi:hypothetical protein